MANLQYSPDIKTDVLDRADELTNGNSPYDSTVEAYINRQYLAICRGGTEINPSVNEAWWWLRKDPPGSFVINPVYQAGTVSVTNNNATITFSATVTPSMVGRLFKTDSHADVFRIATHTDATDTATLDTVYTGPTSAALSYKLMQTDYTLATDILDIIAPLRVDQQNTNPDPYKIYGADLDVLQREWPDALIAQGVPDVFALVQTGDTWKIRFNRYGLEDSTKYIRVEYDYLYRPTLLSTFTGTEAPVIPWEYRHVLAEAALYLLLVQKNDSRADTAGLAAQSGLMAMAKDMRQQSMWYSPEAGQIITRQIERQWGRRLRTSSGLLIA